MTKTDKPFLKALAGETITPPPFWLMRQAGRYLPEYKETRAKAQDFLTLCYSPELAIEVTLQPLRRYHMDAAILFSDILVIPHALGRRVEFIAGEGPRLAPLEGMADVEALDVENVCEHLKPVFEIIRGLTTAIPESTALIGFCGAPWTLATYMIEGGGSKDYAKTKTWAYGTPEAFGALIATLTDAASAYLIKQIDNGAQAAQIFDSWAGVLPEKEFHTWVTTPTRQIIERVKTAHPAVPVIGFPRGAALYYPRFIRETKVDAVSLDSTTPLDWAAEALQPLCAIQGNLDPIAVVAGGDFLDAAIDRILKALSKGPFVFNLGHGVAPNTPPENVARLADRIRSFKP